MTMAVRFRVVPAAVLLLLGCGDNEIQSGNAPLLGGQATVTAGVRSTRGLNQTKPLDQFTLSSWSSRNGLPQNSVQVIHQSANGYIWIGTQEGLVRFNGSEFRVFDRTSTPDMRNNHITALIEADSSRLWVGTYGGGLFCLSTAGTVCATVDEGLSSNTVVSLAQTRTAGYGWARTNPVCTMCLGIQSSTIRPSKGFPETAATRF